jgi:hypothetical protein
MRPINRAAFISLFVVGSVIPVTAAQDGPRDRRAPSTAAPPPTLTGKERLGHKWTDEQRIDNCKVPIDRRGTRPRPITCSHDPSRE